MDNYIQVWKNSFNYAGRARRKEYWMFALFNFAVVVVLSLLGNFLAADKPQLSSAPLMIFAIAAIFPAVAAGVRRLHDTGRSGWWFLINFVPFIGGLWFLVLTVLDSKPEANAWGVSPKYNGIAVV